MHVLSLLAKKAVEKYICEGEIISSPEGFPKEFLTKKAGTFVTIIKNGKLRGCIGTYLPTKNNIAEEVIHNAIAAATEDYRFGKVKKEELNMLSYEVSILGKPAHVKDISALNPKKYGIIVKTKEAPFKKALLLPDLEGIETVEQQIFITCQKAGIDPEKEKILIHMFKVKKFK